MSHSEAVHSLFRVGYIPPEPLSPSLKHWWKERPDLFEPLTFAPQTLPTLDPSYEVDPETAGRDSGCAKQLWVRFRAKWDRGTLAFTSRLATPSILLGITLTLIGFTGLLTALTGTKIHALHFLVEHMPVSIVLSLTLIRAGITSMMKGVRLSRRQQRFRLEAQRYRRQLRLEQHLFETQNQAEKVQEIKRLNARLSPPMRLDQRLRAGYPYGKFVDDQPTSSVESYRHRLVVRQTLENREFVGKTELLLALPRIDMPLEYQAGLEVDPDLALDLTPPLSNARTPAFTEKWYTWWHNRMETLGYLDLVVGQLMLVCALGSLTLMCLGSSHAPAIFQMLANDPGISLTFTFILLANWVNCCRTGWRTLTWKRREARRNSVEADFQLIDLGLELKKMDDFHQWMMDRLERLAPNSPEEVEAIQAVIQASYRRYKDSLNLQEKLNEAHALRAAGHPKADDGLAYRIHQAGGTLSRVLATPSILLGGIITILGSACLVMSVTGYIPPQLALLAHNTPLSVIFSSGLLVSGIHAVHRGVSMSAQKKKTQNKGAGGELRELFLRGLFPELEHPGQTYRGNPVHTLPPNLELDLDTREELDKGVCEAVAGGCRKLSDGWFALWKKSLYGLWVPDLVLGGFLLFSSLAGLAICLGAPATANLAFISTDPSLSIFFCLSLLGLSVDCLNTAWRVGTFHQRKHQDKQNLELLRACYQRFSTSEGYLSATHAR